MKRKGYEVMEEFKSNSHKSKREKRCDKIVTGSVKTKKKSEVRKFTDVFISDDISKVKDSVIFDILIPSFKKIISEVVTNGIDMILYGEAGRTKKSGGVAASKVSYRNYSDYSNEHRNYKPAIRSTYNYDEVILDSRGDAEAVLMRLDEIIDEYDFASVGDMYDIVGVTGSYTDNDYGWTDIRNARIERVREGYVIRMPKALPID